MKYKNLVEPIKMWALNNQEDQGNNKDERVDISSTSSSGGFNWSGSLEGMEFWELVYRCTGIETLKRHHPNLPWSEKVAKNMIIGNYYFCQAGAIEFIIKMKDYVNVDRKKILADFVYLSKESIDLNDIGTTASWTIRIATPIETNWTRLRLDGMNDLSLKEYKKRELYNTFEYNKGDLIVFVGDLIVGDYPGLVDEGEIVKLGGAYWLDSNLARLNKMECVAYISKKSRRGNGINCTQPSQGIMKYKFRKATKDEESIYNAFGVGANSSIAVANKPTLKKGDRVDIKDVYKCVNLSDWRGDHAVKAGKYGMSTSLKVGTVVEVYDDLVMVALDGSSLTDNITKFFCLPYLISSVQLINNSLNLNSSNNGKQSKSNGKDLRNLGTNDGPKRGETVRNKSKKSKSKLEIGYSGGGKVVSRRRVKRTRIRSFVG